MCSSLECKPYFVSETCRGSSVSLVQHWWHSNNTFSMRSFWLLFLCFVVLNGLVGSGRPVPPVHNNNVVAVIANVTVNSVQMLRIQCGESTPLPFCFSASSVVLECGHALNIGRLVVLSEIVLLLQACACMVE